MAKNDHYFAGLERERWRLLASGFTPSFRFLELVDLEAVPLLQDPLKLRIEALLR